MERFYDLTHFKGRSVHFTYVMGRKRQYPVKLVHPMNAYNRSLLWELRKTEGDKLLTWRRMVAEVQSGRVADRKPHANVGINLKFVFGGCGKISCESLLWISSV